VISTGAPTPGSAILNGMDVVSFDASTVSQFAIAVRPVIEADPAGSSVLATVLDQALHSTTASQELWLLLLDAGRAVGAAMQTPPHNLFLTPMSQQTRAPAIHVLIEHLAGDPAGPGRELPGVSGQLADAQAFATAWSERRRCGQRVTMSERLFQLDADPVGPVGVPGKAREATEADLDIVTSWLTAFSLEAVPEQAAVDPTVLFHRRLRRGAFVLWEDDGEPVSLAGLHPCVAGVSRIGPVYTPGLRRGRGYGSAVTTAASRLGLRRGCERCVLYTDLSNPTPNSIYRKLGYRPVADSVMIAFS
jgi:GNAT superfamily N-acetyltransferase